MLKKKIWANFQRIIELFTQKNVTKLSKILVWDPGSGIRDPGSEIRDPEKTYSGSRIQGSKRHRIPDPDTQHWYTYTGSDPDSSSQTGLDPDRTPSRSYHTSQKFQIYMPIHNTKFSERASLNALMIKTAFR